MSHGDAVTKLPEGFIELASSDTSSFSIIADATRRIFGMQFHPEVFHTVNGKKFLENKLEVLLMDGAMVKVDSVEEVKDEQG